MKTGPKLYFCSQLALAMIVVGLLLSPLSAFALDLETAKIKGLVGETTTGYLAAVQPSPEVDKLVEQINSERKQRYQMIAEKNGTPVAAVEGLAGKKALELTPSGQYIQTSGGAWTKK